MDPNHFLGGDRLSLPTGCNGRRGRGRQDAVSSSIIDRVAATRPHPPRSRSGSNGLYPLHTCRMVSAGEESAGASFLRLDGTVWTTDKDANHGPAGRKAAITESDPESTELRLLFWPTAIYAMTNPPRRRKERARNCLRKCRAATLAGEPIRPITRARQRCTNWVSKWLPPTAGLPPGPPALRILHVYAESFGRVHLDAILTERAKLSPPR